MLSLKLLAISACTIWIFSIQVCAMTRMQAIKELRLESDFFSESELKKAYRNRCLETHPDKGGSHEAFIRVAQAYEVLSSGKRYQRRSSSGGGGRDNQQNDHHRQQKKRRYKQKSQGDEQESSGEKHRSENNSYSHERHDDEETTKRRMFEEAEDLFFDIFETMFRGDEGITIVLDKLFAVLETRTNVKLGDNPFVRRLKRFSRSLVRWGVTRLGRKLLCLFGDKEVSVSVDGHTFTFRTSDFLAWRNQVLRRRRQRREQNKQRWSSSG